MLCGYLLKDLDAKHSEAPTTFHTQLEGAIAAGIKDPDTLTTYGKRDLLRSKKGRSIQEGSGPRIELPIEDEEDEGEEGRPLK